MKILLSCILLAICIAAVFASEPKQVMVGAAAHEWLLFTAMDPAAATLDDNHLKARVSGRVGSSAEALIYGYKQLLASRGEPHDPLSVFAAIETDRVFRVQAERLADALAERGQSPYHYEFTWRSPLLNGKLKSCHAIDIAFVFATHAIDDSGDALLKLGHRVGAAAGALLVQEVETHDVHAVRAHGGSGGGSAAIGHAAPCAVRAHEHRSALARRRRLEQRARPIVPDGDLPRLRAHEGTWSRSPISSTKRWPPVGWPLRASTRVSTRRSFARVIPT
jgi:hypothetical protein